MRGQHAGGCHQTPSIECPRRPLVYMDQQFRREVLTAFRALFHTKDVGTDLHTKRTKCNEFTYDIKAKRIAH